MPAKNKQIKSESSQQESSMVTSDTSSLDYEPVSSLLTKTILSAFTILTAFNIRDTVTQVVAVIAPSSATKKVLFTLSITVFFLFITVLMAFMWQDRIQ